MEKLKFPIKGHDKCPNCGCTERIAAKVIKELKKDGKLEENLFPQGIMWAVPLFDTTKPIMVGPLMLEKPKIPVLRIFYDVCANEDCLTPYVTGVDFNWEEVKLPPVPQGLSGRPAMTPPFGRG